jgi:hypothetical protein
LAVNAEPAPASGGDAPAAFQVKVTTPTLAVAGTAPTDSHHPQHQAACPARIRPVSSLAHRFPRFAVPRTRRGLTPPTAPGAATIRTGLLERFLVERRSIVIDTLLFSWDRSIPGAIGLKNAGWGGSTSDTMQGRLQRKMHELTKGDLSVPIVTLSFNSERFDGRNLALRLAALGYTQIHWYRGGREAWEAKGLPETAVDIQPW